MKRIKDERLQLQNLKYIRIIFLIQNIGIIGILGYDFVNKGLDGMKDNPLWFVFLVSMIASTYLSMSVSTDYESRCHYGRNTVCLCVNSDYLYLCSEN